MARKDIKSVLVIGGTGFIGSAVVARLSQTELAQITVVHTSSLSHGRPSRAHYYRIDAKDAFVGDLMRDHDAIVLLASPDITLMKQLVAMIRKARPRHVLYASTVLLYDSKKDPAHEETPLRARNEYERAKLAEEKMVRAALKSPIKLTIARLGNVYGDVLNKGIIGNAFHALHRENSIPVSGNVVRDYIFIDDVAEALTTLVLEPPQGNVEVINIATGIGTPLNTLLAGIEKIAGRKLTRIEGAPRDESPRIVADIQKMKKRIGKPAFRLNEGLKETYRRFSAWYDNEKL